MVQVLRTGWVNRRVASTSMNRESSRSHAVFTLTIESKKRVRQPPLTLHLVLKETLLQTPVSYIALLGKQAKQYPCFLFSAFIAPHVHPCFLSLLLFMKVVWLDHCYHLPLVVQETNESIAKIKTSLLNLVDLAGSERQRDTQTAGLRLKVTPLSLSLCVCVCV